MNIFTPAVLASTVQTIKPVPSFFRTAFFPTVITSNSQSIVIDESTSKARVTPFVHMMSPAGIVEKNGFASKVLTPAYIKDARNILPTDTIKRQFGEPLNSNISPMARKMLIARQNLEDQINMKDRRIEVMCSQALINANQVIKGTGFDSTIDFGRANGNAYATTVKWSHTATDGTYDADIPSDLESAASIIQKAGGGRTVFVMDTLAYGYFRKNKYVIASDSKWIEAGRVVSSLVDPKQFDDGEARFCGLFGDFEIWVYQAEYVDPVTNSATNVMPDYVCVGIGTNVQGEQHFGAIMNIDKLESVDYFLTSGTVRNPGQSYDWICLESSPLMVPGRMNATVKMTVHS